METIDYEKELERVKKESKKKIKKIKKQAKKEVKEAHAKLEALQNEGKVKEESFKDKIEEKQHIEKKCAWPSCDKERMDENSLLCEEHDAEYKDMVKKAGDTVSTTIHTIMDSLLKKK